MAGLEASISASEIGPIAGLQYKLPQVAPFVVDRSESYFVPSGGSEFSPGNVRTMRIPITGHNFCDLSTAVLEFNVHNSSAAQLQPICGAASFFNELKVMVSGVEVERLGGGGMSLARLENALERGLPLQKRVDMHSMGFPIITSAAGVDSLQGGPMKHETIPAAAGGAPGSKKVYMKIFSGLCQQHLFMPLAFLSGGGLVFEYLLQGTAADACDTSTHAGTDWRIDSVKCHIDTLSVDSALMDSYAQHLLKGSSLVVPYRS